MTGTTESAEVQTARLIAAAVVGDRGARNVLAALDLSRPGNLARLVRLLTADQIRKLATEGPTPDLKPLFTDADLDQPPGPGRP